MKGFSYKQLRYIAAVASAGSIAGASEKLNLSASSFREALSDAESKIGAQLFVRSRAKGMRPTPEGQRFLGFAEPLFEAHELFEKKAAGIAHTQEREITIGILANASPIIMPRLIAELDRRGTVARYRIAELDSEALVDAVRAGAHLVGLGFNDFLHPSLTFVSLFRAQLHIALPRNHRLAEARSLSLHELAEEPYIFLNFPGARAYYSGLFDHHRITPNTMFVVDSTEMARRLVEGGFGYATFNMSPVGKHASADAIVRVPLETDYWSPTFGMFYEAASASLRQVREIESAARAAWL